MPLRDYQERAVENGAAELEKHRSVCLVGPTGCGKTNTGVALAQKYGKALWLCNRRDLCRQTQQRVYSYGVDWPVRTIQGFKTRARWHWPEADVLVVDECHHAPSDSWEYVLRRYPNAKVIGLTASPERYDGRPLDHLFESMVKIADYSELMAQGHLVPCRVFRPNKDINRGLAQDPLTAYQRYTPGMCGFCFVQNNKHAQMVKESFDQAGVKTAIVHAKSSEKDRVRAMAELESGDIRLIINCATMTEGVDVPSAQVCILARKCGHEGIYIQTTGRVLRPSPGKPYGVLLDLTSASERHGMPTADRAYSLTGTAISQSNPIPVRQCYECGAVMEAWRKSCITCDTAFIPGVFRPPKIKDVALQEVYNGSETPEDAKQTELARMTTIGWRWAAAAEQFEKLFGSRPTQAQWLRLGPKAIRQEWFKLEKKFGANKASVIIKSYTGQWPDYQLRFELEK